MNSDDLVRELKTSKKMFRRVALLIGFSGASVLFGHSTMEALLCDLFAKSHDPRAIRDGKSHFKPNQILSSWGALDDDVRLDLLRKHTFVHAADHETIDVLTEMFRQKYIELVFMSDPANIISFHMDSPDLSWERYHCSRERSDLVGALASFRDRLLLVNASDLALEGFVPGVYGVNRDTRKDVTAAVKNVLRKFDKILCWGWCDYNVSLGTLLDAAPDTVYILGAGSYCNKTIIDGEYPQLVLEESRVDEVTTDIIKEIGRKIFPEGIRSPSRGTNGGAAQAPPEIDPKGAFRSHHADLCLLWDDTVCAEILDQAKRVRMSLIGVDGDLVRSRVAFATTTSLIQEGARCFWRPGADLLALDRLIAARASAAYERTTYIVVELSASPRGDFITRYLGQWTSSLASAANLRLIVLTDPVVLAPVPAAEIEPSIQHKVLAADACISIGNITRWVREAFERSLTNFYTASERDFFDLAEAARRTLREQLDGPAADWIHEALGQWLSESHEAGAVSEGKLPFQTCKEIWARIAATYATEAKRKAVKLDFDSSDLQGPRADEDFELKRVDKRRRRGPAGGP